MEQRFFKGSLNSFTIHLIQERGVQERSRWEGVRSQTPERSMKVNGFGSRKKGQTHFSLSSVLPSQFGKLINHTESVLAIIIFPGPCPNELLDTWLSGWMKETWV